MNGRERGRLLRDDIFAAYEANADERRPNRLRPSELGHECTRYLWLRFRWADTFERFEGRMHRLFATGHSQEDRLIADLRRLGAEVFARDPDNPAEQISVTVLDGHSKGFLDGIAGAVPHTRHEWILVECKTHSEKSFKQLVDSGVEISKPQHYAQMQLYMHEHALPEALYIAVNKNNDDLFCEFCDYNERYALNLKNKAERIIYGADIPPKINASPTFFKCKMCSASPTCHGGELPSRSCRTCVHSRPMSLEDKQRFETHEPDWLCELRGAARLDLKAQKAGCAEHRYHPDMVGGVFQREENGAHTYEKAGATYVDSGPIGDKAVNPLG